MSRSITPKDVFQRSNMPSRWERITNVSPKTAPDRKYLAFVAARYRGDERLPLPDALEAPAEVSARHSMQVGGWAAAAVAVVIGGVGLAAQLTVVVAVAVVILVAAAAVTTAVAMSTAPAIRQYQADLSRCERAESRLHSDPMDSEDTRTLNEMITCDEGTLTYCAAKIASEIEQDSGWEPDAAGFTPLDLREELAEVGASARQIAEDRKATELLERGRLRDDPEVRAVIEEDKQVRGKAIALLAARVHAFADYRDHVHRCGMAALRERSSLNRMVRLVSDEQATDRPL